MKIGAGVRLFTRENYLNKIRGFCHDDGMIRVITGVRRCGKSCLMRCIAKELRPEGGFSIFITGSNSYLLPGEIATKLSGRYIEFGMKTLDFSEYCQMKRFFELPVNPGPVTEFDACILEGGLPKAMDYSGLADNRINYGPVLENIVYCYARAQGCKVSVGRIGKLECDFILRNPEMGYAYIQVAMTIMADRSTEECEYRPFEQIRDNYPKYLLTRSDPIQQRDGIIHANIPEFMQEGRTF